MDNALIVVAKKPVPGQTKTRLCPPLSPEPVPSSMSDLTPRKRTFGNDNAR